VSKAEESARGISAITFGSALAWIGIQHFTNTGFFTPIVPAILGFPEFWVYLSGLVEVILGLGLIAPLSRRRAAFSTAVFLVLVYWANLNMWIHDITVGETNFTTTGHVFRAIIQVGMIWLSLWIAKWPLKKER
tara:strand:+ start:434 stop:835 length:402 start_codon:yes stop_codon:yes gene_type:complete